MDADNKTGWMKKYNNFEQRLVWREWRNWYKIEDYFVTDIKGRIVRVKKYRNEITNRVKEHRSFQDKNLLNSVTLHKEMSK